MWFRVIWSYKPKDKYGIWWTRIDTLPKRLVKIFQGSFTWEDVLFWNFAVEIGILTFGSLRLPEPCKLSLVVWWVAPFSCLTFLSAQVKGTICPCCVQSCLTLFKPIDCRSPGSSVHGISQARTLEWGAIPFCRESSHPRIEPVSLVSPSLEGGFFTTVPPGKQRLFCQWVTFLSPLRFRACSIHFYSPE